MDGKKLKEALKSLKVYFPTVLQRAGVWVWRAMEIPITSVLERRSIINTRRVFWPVAEVADFDRFKILGPAVEDTLVDVAFTLISPGTERAQLLGLPGTINHDDHIAYFPGYSGSGKIISVGKKVTNFKAGDRFAGRIQHGSPAVVSEKFLFRIPDSVSLEEAAFIEFGIIVLQGIHKARIKPGNSVLILGQGMIGQLANRLSRLAGGAPIFAVANSTAKAIESLGPGGADRFLTVDELSSEGVGKGFDVVIEATGNKDILPFACSLARKNGRIIGLGTPRGMGNINLGQHESCSGISLFGAHISGMPQNDQRTGLWTYQSEGKLFLDLLAQGRLALNDLITKKADPSQAGEIYESLKAGNSRMIGILFDWEKYSSENN